MLFGLCLVVMCAQPASGAVRRVAVLELVDTGRIGAQAVTLMGDLVRGAATALPADAYLMMTRENIVALLPPGRSLADCEGDCEVETGRMIGADFVVSGEVLRVGARVVLSLKLHQVADARLIATAQGGAADVESLEVPTVAAARTLLAKLPIEQRAAPARAGFGGDLGAPSAPGSIPPLRAPAPAKTLAAVDLDYLKRVQTAKRAEQEHHEPFLQIAEAWARAAQQTSDPARRRQAHERADAWRVVNRTRCARARTVARVRARYDADRRKLRELEQLDDDLLPQAQKRAYRREFVAAYADWRAALRQPTTDTPRHRCAGPIEAMLEGAAVPFDLGYRSAAIRLEHLPGYTLRKAVAGGLRSGEVHAPGSDGPLAWVVFTDDRLALLGVPRGHPDFPADHAAVEARFGAGFKQIGAHHGGWGETVTVYRNGALAYVARGTGRIEWLLQVAPELDVLATVPWAHLPHAEACRRADE